MPEPDDDLAPPDDDPLAGERDAFFPDQPDRAAPALDHGPGEAGEPSRRTPRRPGAAGRALWWIGVAGFSLNLLAWGGVLAGVVPHTYPYLPVAIGFMVLIWVGRALMVSARARA